MGQWVGGTAREVSFFQPKITEHSFRDRYVLWLPTVRGAGQRNLVGAPSKLVQIARAEKWHQLERLRTGAPERLALRVPRVTNQGIARDYRGGHTMDGFDGGAAGYDYIDIIGCD